MTNKLTLRNVAIEAAIADVQIGEAKESGGQVSQHLLGLAQTFESVDQFIGACKLEEAFLKSDAGKALVADVFNKQGIKESFDGNAPKCWTQAKSNIKRAWKAGIDPKGHQTESELRKALIAKNKAEKPENQIAELCGLLAKSVKHLPEAQQNKAVETIQSMVDKYTKIVSKLLADKKPVPVQPEVMKHPKAKAAKAEQAQVAA